MLYTALGLCAIALLVMLFIQTSPGKNTVRRIVESELQNLLLDGASVEIGGLDGNLLTSAVLADIVVRQAGDTTMNVGTIRAEYRLLPLLRRRIVVRHLEVGDALVIARQMPDSTFNLQHLLKPTEAESDTSSAPFVVRVDSVDLRRARVEVHFLSPDQDSALVVENIELCASQFVLEGDQFNANLNHFAASATSADGEGNVQLLASGAISEEQLALETLRLTSAAGTDISGSARVAFAPGRLPDVTADLRAEPLALADVRAFSDLDLYGDPRLRVTARSDADHVSFTVQGSPHPGATISLDGSIEQSDGLRYQVTGQLARVNPAALTRNAAHDADLNGDLRIDLSGTSLRTLDGPLFVNLADTRIGNLPIEHLQIDGAFRTGRLEFGMDADVPGLRVHIEGDTRPFDGTPVYNVAGNATEVNLARLLRDPTQTTSFRGSFEVNGAGIDPANLVAEAVVDLQDVNIGAQRLDRLEGVADIQRGRVRFVGEAALANGGGRIHAAGDADLFGESASYRIADGRVEHLNIAALTNNPTHLSDLSGSFSLSGSGTDLASASLTFSTSLRESRFGDYDLVSAHASGTLQGGLVRLEATGDLGRLGAGEIAGTARPFDSVLAYQLTGRVDHLDLAELLNDPDRGSDISGAFSATGRGTALESLSLDAMLDFDYSSFGAQEITSGAVQLRLVGGDLSTTGTLETPEGAVDLDVTGRPFDPEPFVALGERMCFQGVDLAKITGNPDLRTSLDGCARGDLLGLDPATMLAEVTVSLSRSGFNDAEIESGDVVLSLRDGFVEAEADLILRGFDVEESRLAVRINGRPFDPNPTYAGRGRLAEVDIVALAGLEYEQPVPLSLDFNVEGSGLAFESMALRGSVSGGRSKFGSATLDTLQVQFDLDRGRLMLDTLLLRSDIVEMYGGGRITLTDRASSETSNLQISGTLYDLSPLDAYTAQHLSLTEGEFETRISGEPGAPLCIDVRVSAQRFVYGSTALSAMTSHLSGTFDATSGELALLNRLDFKFLSVPSVLVERGRLDMRYDGVVFSVEGDVRVDRRRSFDFASSFDFGQEERAAAIERINLDLDGDRWTLAQPARISIGQGFRFENFLLQADAGSQQIAIDGVIDREGEQAFILTMEDFNAASIADLAGIRGLGGRLSASLLMTGSAHNPEIAGAASLVDFTSNGEPVGSVDVSLDYANARLDLDARLEHIDGNALTARGHVPLNFSLADFGDNRVASITEAEDADELSIAVRADSFQVGWIQPFLNPRSYTEVSGLLYADLTADGTQSNPLLKGRARLENGRIGLAFAGRVFETLSASIRFAGNRAIIQQAVLADADGTERMKADGTVTLQKLSLSELDIRMEPYLLLAMETPTYDGLVIDRGADSLRLSGSLTRPVVRGSAVLSGGTINMTDELVARRLEDVRLSDEDLRINESRFGRRITARDTSVSRFYKSLDLDIDVDIGRDVWLRSPSGLLPFSAEFSGQIQAVKAPSAEQTSMFGTVDVTRGWVETLNRRFDIQQGTLIFNGLMDETLVDLEAKLNIRTDPQVGTTAVEINLFVTGRLGDDLTITLTSNPQLDNADIVSLIVTGQLAENVIGGGALAGVGEGFFLGQLSSIAEGIGSTLGENIGLSLDVVQIDQTPDGLVIRLGKHLSNKAFVSLGLPIKTSSSTLTSEDNPELTLEYVLLRWLLLQLEYQNGVGGGLIYQYAY